MKRLLCLVVCFLLVINVVRVGMQLQTDSTLTPDEYEYLSAESVLQIFAKYEYSAWDSLNSFVVLYEEYFGEYYAYQEYVANTTWYERIINRWKETHMGIIEFNPETGEFEKHSIDYPDPVKYAKGFYEALYSFGVAFVGDVLTLVSMTADLLSVLLGFQEYVPTA